MNIRLSLRTIQFRTCMVVLLMNVLAIVCFSQALASTEITTTRSATAQEQTFCVENYETFGPVTDDCGIVPLPGYVMPDGTILDNTIYEDDAFGRWDCVRMGNHQCGDILYFDIDGQWQGWHIWNPNRPGCFVEPSNTLEGFEIIFYSDISGHGPPEYIGDELGFEVKC